MSREQPTTDRGRVRRTAILEATIRVVADKGVGGATHRAVAAQAGVPLAATTYYFKSKSDLLLSAFEHLIEGRIEVLDEAIRLTPEPLSPEIAAALWANALAENLRTERHRVMAEFEMHLEASRSHDLRSIHKRWEDKAMQYFTTGMTAMGSRCPEADAALVLSVLTGLEIGELAFPTPHVERTVAAPLLRRLLSALVPTPPTPT